MVNSWNLEKYMKNGEGVGGGKNSPGTFSSPDNNIEFSQPPAITQIVHKLK